MPQHIITRLAAIFTIFIFLGNDVMASVVAFRNLNGPIDQYEAIHPNLERNRPQASTRSLPASENILPTEGLELPETFSNRAKNTLAFIGSHPSDPMGSPTDDVFEIDLKEQWVNYQFGYLQYEVKGLANPEALPKAINGHEVYMSEDLQAGNDWQRVTVMVDYSDLRPGINSIRFAMPHNTDLAVEVKNVQIHLNAKPKAVNKGLKLNRQSADNKDFRLVDEENQTLTFKNRDVEMPSIPKSIRNITRNAIGYGMRKSGNNLVKVAVGVDPTKLTTPNDLKEANIFFYDRIDHSWKKAHSERVDMKEVLLEAAVPPNTDYFAGMIKSPDMPEASAFLPTGISGIETANPATGMNLISPPQQSKTGEANISYPIAIPAGRQGLAPSLALNYSSDAGTGWLGVGWNLSTPSVSIDTRWGAPTFPAPVQEEVYSMNGQSLIQEGGTKGNRAKIVGGVPVVSPRVKGNIRFFENTMSSYKTIERIGDDPTEYVWVHTTANQTKYYYGTQDGTTVYGDAVLADGSGNIVKWNLTKIEDKWGNNVKYTYQKRQFTAANYPNLIAMKDGGWTIILTDIDYTGHNGSTGKYKVAFESSSNRFDATVSMKTGIKILDDHRLNKIVVSFDGDEIKNYQLNYKEDGGDFGKTLLESISDNRNGEEFYKHDFEYHSKTLSFGPAEIIGLNQQADNLLGDIGKGLEIISQPILNIFKGSGIKTTKTWGFSAGGGVGLGISPLTGSYKGKKYTLTGNFSAGQSYSEDIRNLQDMNGDGIPDLVVNKRNGRGFYPLYKEGNALTKGSFTVINTSDKLFYSISNTRTWGYDFSLGDKIFFIGQNWNKTRSEVTNYTMDYNADGYLDLVFEDSEGKSKIEFGYLNSLGELQYSGNSSYTPNPVFKKDDLDIIDTEDTDLKDIEIVKIWTAPIAGNIDIIGLAESIGSLTGETKVAVQKGSNFLVHSFRVVDANNSVTTNYSNVSVVKGEEIIFRTRSSADGQQDLITWNPEINYTNKQFEDGNSIEYTESNYEEAFILSGGDAITIDGDRKIKVALNRSVSAQLTDDLLYKFTVVEKNSSGVVLSTNEYVNILDEGTTSLNNATFVSGSSSLNFGSGLYLSIPNFVAANTYTFHFSLFSTSNVDWKNVKFRPTVEIDLYGNCEDGAFFYPTVEYGTYNRVAQLEDKFDTQELEYDEEMDYRIWPSFSYTSSDVQAIFDSAPGSNQSIVYMTVKDGTQLLSKIALVFDQANGTLTYENCPFPGINPTTITSSSSATLYSLLSPDFNDDLFVEFFAEGFAFSENTADFILNQMDKITLQESQGGTGWTNVRNSSSQFNVFHQDPSYVGDKILHWGQFAWSFDKTVLEATPINVTELKPDFEGIASDSENQFDSQNTPDAGFFAENGDDLDPMGHQFLVLKGIRGEQDDMLRSYEKASYDVLTLSNLVAPQVASSIENLDRYAAMGQHIAVYASSGMTSPGKFGEVEKISSNLPNRVNPSIYNAFGAPLESVSKTTAITGGNDIIGTYSTTFNGVGDLHGHTVVQMQDYNGDGYPDRVHDNGTDVNINFTTPLGGHSNAASLFTINELTKSTSQNMGAVNPGSYINNDTRFVKLKSVLGSVSASLGTNVNLIQTTDINGDGLPDRIQAAVTQTGISVALNNSKSYGLLKPLDGYTHGIPFSNSLNFALSPNLNKLSTKKTRDGKGYAIGIGVNHVANSSNTLFVDLNGDGLADCISIIGTEAFVLINNGTTFSQYDGSNSITVPADLNDSHGNGFSASLTGTVSFPILTQILPGFDLKMSVTATGSVNFSVNETQATLQDINGDGYLDYVSEAAAGIEVKYSQLDQSNKLKKVTNPLGGSFEIDYERVGNKNGYFDPVVITHLNKGKKILWDMPQSKLVMSHLTIDDGLHAEDANSLDIDGSDQLETYFYYDGGIKSRRERVFSGFSRIEQRSLPFSNLIDRGGTLLSSFDIDPSSPLSAVYYVSSVKQYITPSQRDYLSRIKADYTSNLISEEYVYLNTKTGVDISGNNETHTITPISMDIYTYEFRNVCIDPGSGYFNELYPSTDPLATINWLTVDETQTIFPSVVVHQKMQSVDGSPTYTSQKYLITYDNRFNLIQYEDEGILVGRSQGTTIVDSYTREWYDVQTLNHTFGSLSPDPNLSDDHYYAFVIPYVPDPSYSDDIVYIPKAADDCFNLDNQNSPSEEFTIVSSHKKAMSETIDILQPVFNDVYVDKLIAVMTYFDPISAAGQTNILQTHKIYENSIVPANLERHSEVDLLTSNMFAPAEISNFLSSVSPIEKATTNITYEANGNVSSIQGPANATNQRMLVDYTYDTEVAQFVVGVSNSYGESTCHLYDYATGNLLKRVDINGHAMQYEYDNMYRVKEVWAPRQLYDNNASATISFEYYPFGYGNTSSSPTNTSFDVPVALTFHNFDGALTEDPFSTPEDDCEVLADLSERSAISNPVRTATFLDGLGQTIQIKKDVLEGDASHSNIAKYLVTGWAQKDPWGKVESSNNSILEGIANPIWALSSFTSDPVQRQTTDFLGRPSTVESKVGKAGGYKFSTTKISQGYTTYLGVEYTWKSNTTEDNQAPTPMKTSSQLSLINSRGQQRFSQQIGANPSHVITTEFVYNPIGELLSSIDPLGETTTYTYDQLGRTIQEVHPDRGTTTWTYDATGNITILNNEGTGTNDITYTYDYNRLLTKTLPDNDDLYHVAYTYGSNSDGKNGAGRVTSVVQGTNFKTENYKYDETGNLIFEEKLINVPQWGTKTWATEFQFDSWGRIHEMLYPDGEEVSYSYLSSGELTAIDNVIPGQTPWKTIETITYDGFGQMKYMKYGNGAETHFDYDNITRVMNTVEQKAKASSSSPLTTAYTQTFQYDDNGRIASLNHLKGTSTSAGVVHHNYNYTYDNFNRLTQTTGGVNSSSYSLNLTYNDAGGILTKDQTLGSTTTNLTYNYLASYKHRIHTVDNEAYLFNSAGSIESITPFGDYKPSEQFIWNEEEWLMAVQNANGYHHYVYDHNGERIMKSSLTSGTTAFDGQGNTNTTVLDPYAVYVNPYYVVTSFANYENVSKHYFMGSQRVASEIVIYDDIEEPESETSNGTSSAQGNENKDNELKDKTSDGLDGAVEGLNENANPVFSNLSKILTKLGLEENKDFTQEQLKQKHSLEDYYNADAIALLRQSSGSAESGNPPHATRLRYWYHPNYLGNVDMITDLNGEVNQYYVYSPFGENLYDWSANTLWNTPYRFNGKELDPETGNQYYGARYYDPKISVWLSVDPWAHKYPSVTSYNYVLNNPVHLVDPDGRGVTCPTCPGDAKYDIFREAEQEFVYNNDELGSVSPANNIGEKVKKGAQGVLAETAYTGIQSKRARDAYNKTVAPLDPSDSEGRTKAKTKARAKTPLVTRTMAESMRPKSGEANRSGGTANKTNANVNKTVNGLGKIGRFAGGASAVIGIVNVASAEDKSRALATEGGAFVGAIAGGEVGAAAGASIGVWFFGVGAVPGAIIGGIIGSIGGGIYGAQSGAAIHDEVEKALE